MHDHKRYYGKRPHTLKFKKDIVRSLGKRTQDLDIRLRNLKERQHAVFFQQ